VNTKQASSQQGERSSVHRYRLTSIELQITFKCNPLYAQYLSLKY